MGTLFLSLLPCPDATFAIEFIALSAFNRVLDQVLANNAFKIFINRLTALGPFDVTLLKLVIVHHRVDVGFNALRFIIQKFLFAMLFKLFELTVELLDHLLNVMLISSHDTTGLIWVH